MEEIKQTYSDEYYDTHEILVDRGQGLLRIDKYLFDKLANVSRNRLQNAIKAGAVRVNEQEIKPNYKVHPGDKIDMVIPRPPDESGRPRPENIPLDIIYEDDTLLVLNKPAGMVVHPGIGNHSGTLVNALAYYFIDDSLPVLEGNSGDRIGLVHRIDKNTSGLLVIAKTEYAISHLAKQFFHHTIERKYVALVWGEPEPEDGQIECHIGRHPRFPTLRYCFEEGLEGKWAKTHYKMLEPMYYVSLVECQLETGRTHQIRVHMKHIGHPLFSDTSYGGGEIRKGTIYGKYKQFVRSCFELMPRQALHAHSLGFEHPETHERMYFESELPDDFQSCMDAWRDYVRDKKTKLNPGEDGTE